MKSNTKTNSEVATEGRRLSEDLESLAAEIETADDADSISELADDLECYADDLRALAGRLAE